MLSLQCPVQRYAWGKQGAKSLVARIKHAGDSSFTIDPNECYAEFWVGTHPSGPAKLRASGEPLLTWLQRHPDLVGRVAPSYPHDSLVFIFKVLSIRTALSIQSHPDKTLAAQLFARDPTNYKDANHKPEMVIALTPFEAMCGFRPIGEIQANIRAYPELAGLLGDDVVSQFSEPSFGDASSPDTKVSRMRSMFTKFMKSDPVTVAKSVSNLISRVSSSTSTTSALESAAGSIKDISNLDDLMVRLNADFPGDIGVMCPLLLNCVELRPGESFFMGPAEPHAYISGDCIECMAPSDNVIRSGLTPKFKDVDVLCDMLTYSTGKLSTTVHPIESDAHNLIYRPKYSLGPEFEVECTSVTAGGSYDLTPLPCCSMVIVVEGACRIEVDSERSAEVLASAPAEIERELDATGGSTFMICANASCRIIAHGAGVKMYRAHINLAME